MGHARGWTGPWVLGPLVGLALGLGPGPGSVAGAPKVTATADPFVQWVRSFPYVSAIDADAVAVEVQSLTTDPIERRFLVTWGYFESGWGRHPLGDCTCWRAGVKVKAGCPWSTRTIGTCKSFGVLQVQKPGRWVAGATPGAVVVDRRLGFRVGLVVFRHWRARTPTLGAALRGYSTGRTDRGFLLVAARCGWMGCP